MACKEVTKEIGGKQVFCRQWPASKAMVMKAKLIKMGGMDIIPFVEGRADLVSMVQLERKSNPEELVNLVKEFVCSVRVDGKELNLALFDMEYSGKLWEIVEVFTFACEVNFKDFFEQGVTNIPDQP